MCLCMWFVFFVGVGLMFCILISLKAPEVMTENGHDTKVDIWSVGITAIELATGRVPRAELQPMQLVTFVPANPPPRLGLSLSLSFQQ